jgi:PncC family amidohydrolase
LPDRHVQALQLYANGCIQRQRRIRMIALNMNHNLESVLRYLHENKLRLVTAESCTAGLVSSMLAELPGSACWLECSFVTYSRQAKMTILGVQHETIERYNLTSEEVAREMAEGALRLSCANVALADTGLAGPGASGGIPAGTVCFAWSFDQDGKPRTFSETRKFEGDRNRVRKSAAEYVISRIWHYHGLIQGEQRAADTGRLP